MNARHLIILISENLMTRVVVAGIVLVVVEAGAVKGVGHIVTNGSSVGVVMMIGIEMTEEVIVTTMTTGIAVAVFEEEGVEHVDVVDMEEIDMIIGTMTSTHPHPLPIFLVVLFHHL